MPHLHRSVAGRGAIVTIVCLLAAIAGGMAGWTGPYITHAADRQPFVAITFDDGLNGDTTRALADILHEHGARATFFVVGRTLHDQAPLARRMVEQGHLLANHSNTHPRASWTDLRYRQVDDGQQAFKQEMGVCPRFFRPPWGVQTPFLNAAVHRAGMQTVMWDVEVADWDVRDPAELAERVLRRVRPGSIILLHDGEEGLPGADRATQVRALPAILEGLRARGLTSVRLDELLGTAGYLDRCD